MSREMTHLSVDQATGERLLALLEQATKGEQVVLVRPDGAVFQIVPLSRLPKPMFGSVKGLVHIADDFDDPLDDMPRS